MIDSKMKDACDKRLLEINADKVFQTWLADLKNTMTLYYSVQSNRMKLNNISRSTIITNRNVTDTNGYNKISENQYEFMDNNIALQNEFEKKFEKHIEHLLKQCPFDIYNKYLKNITGIGPTSSGILLTRFRPEKIYYVTNMISYAGLATGKDKLHKGQKSPFDAFLKSKLLGVMGVNFKKLKSEYAIYYYNKRIQLINREKIGGEEPRTSAHHDRMATRYMMQQFIKDYYVAYRTLLDIPVVPPYEETKGNPVSHLNGITKFNTFYDITPAENKLKRKETLVKIDYLNSKLRSMIQE